MANKLNGVGSSIRKRLLDTFNRANQSGIGTASDGSLWNTLRGSFSISTNKAVGADANYPMATQSLPFSNVEINLNGAATGSAAALWVTDSGNWWAVGLTQEATDCNCTYYYNTYYYYSASTCVGYTAGNYVGPYNNGNYVGATCASFYCSAYSGGQCTSSVCVAYNGSNCNNYAYNSTNKSTRCSGSYNASNCAAYGCTGYAPYVCNGYSCANYNPGYMNGNMNSGYTNAATAYNYACNIQQTGYSGPFASCSTCYPQYIRVLQSVGNTVSTITQWSISSLASALKVKTSGSQLTISAYSDADMVTQIGSDLVYTPTSVTITPTFGITVVPSGYNQGYTTDSIEIKKN